MECCYNRLASVWWNVCFTWMRPKKKVLVEAAKIIDSNQRHKDKGIIGSEEVRIKWSDLIHFKRTFTDPFSKHREDGYIAAGIVPFHGHARFISPTTVKVEVD